MKRFWERSVEWQRMQELFAELVAAERALDEARDDGDGYLCERARDDYDDAFVAWDRGRKAFRASAAGRACTRLHADPIAIGTATTYEGAAA